MRDHTDNFRARLDALFEELARETGITFGSASDGEYKRSQRWRTKNGWLIEYTTTRVLTGKLKGKFAVMAFAPYGKGARSGKPKQWKRAYLRGFAKRKTARAKAEAIYWKHMPPRPTVTENEAAIAATWGAQVARRLKSSMNAAQLCARLAWRHALAAEAEHGTE